MNKSIDELRGILAEYEPGLKALDEQKMKIKPAPEKWSKKEILGHLIDSAQNNLRRFIVAQYEENPKIVYNQDFWVAISGHAHASKIDLIQLWKLVNLQITAVLQNMPEGGFEKLCMTNDPQPHSIAWLAEDYLKHLLHHLHQVLELEPVPYP